MRRLGPSRHHRGFIREPRFCDGTYRPFEISRLCERARELGLDDVLVETDNAVESLSKHANGPAFLEEVQQTLSRIGARTPRMYLPYSSRSWGENPESFFTLIAAGIRGRHTMDAERADKRQLVRADCRGSCINVWG